MRNHHKQTGFSLVEVLVTLVITTIALLSSISLQLMSKRSIYDAAQRTTAAHLAHGLLHRMRSNPTALVSYLPAGPVGQSSLGDAPATDCLAAAADCDSLEMAAFDLWQWEQHLDGQLEVSGGNATGGLMFARACIVGPGVGGSGNYTVAIAWRGMADIGDPAINNCGSGSGDYGANDEFRRVMVVETFIAER